MNLPRRASVVVSGPSDPGLWTPCSYDASMERLTRIHTYDPNASGDHFQDLRYDYDPVGNPVAIEDALVQNTFKANQVIPNTRTFWYDARYRLVRARGRKHASVTDKSTNVTVSSPDANDYDAYDIRYAYDPVGNFTRNQEYAPGHVFSKATRIDLFNGDKTEATSTDPTLGNYRYDDNGNTTKTPRHSQLAYTFDDQARFVDLGGGGQVRYLRHGDQRVVRLVNKTGVKALGIYLGPFEYHRRTGTTSYTKLVLHAEGHGRHTQAEVVLAGTDSQSLDRFFQHSDHLGSGHCLTKEDGTLLSQEEFFAYGRSSDRRDSRNRYRYIGVERDEDTRLCMTGPRTYDPTIGRFMQGESASSGGVGVAPFAYSACNPIVLSDSDGRSPALGWLAGCGQDETPATQITTGDLAMPSAPLQAALERESLEYLSKNASVAMAEDLGGSPRTYSIPKIQASLTKNQLMRQSGFASGVGPTTAAYQQLLVSAALERFEENSSTFLGDASFQSVEPGLSSVSGNDMVAMMRDPNTNFMVVFTSDEMRASYPNFQVGGGSGGSVRVTKNSEGALDALITIDIEKIRVLATGVTSTGVGGRPLAPGMADLAGDVLRTFVHELFLHGAVTVSIGDYQPQAGESLTEMKGREHENVTSELSEQWFGWEEPYRPIGPYR